MNFMQTHIQRIIALDPRNEPLETRIKDPKKEFQSNGWYNTTITKIDTDSNIG
tara:strand:+ start:727 stop:885 length:159 start_codon:yes stop_codon:yes gene_type:complete